MKRHLVPGLVLILVTVSATAAAHKPKTDVSPGYIPLDSSASLVTKEAADAVGLWDLHEMPADLSTLVPGKMTHVDHCFSFFSLETAAKVCISSVAVAAGVDYSVLVAEIRRYAAVGVTLTPAYSHPEDKPAGSNEFPATALIGCACRVSALAVGGSFGATFGNDQAGVNLSVKIVRESMAYSAIGFTDYQPFHLPLDASGRIDLSAARWEMGEVFNAYNATYPKIEMQIIGFRVGRDFPDLNKIATIRVSPGGPASSRPVRVAR